MVQSKRDGAGGGGLAIELTDTSMAAQAIWEHFVLRVGGAAAKAEAGPTLQDDVGKEAGLASPGANQQQASNRSAPLPQGRTMPAAAHTSSPDPVTRRSCAPSLKTC